MKVINAATGREVLPGQFFQLSGGLWDGRRQVEPPTFAKLIAVKDDFFSAKALIETDAGERWAPLIVRFLHPKFLGQRTAFIPT